MSYLISGDSWTAVSCSECPDRVKDAYEARRCENIRHVSEVSATMSVVAAAVTMVVLGILGMVSLGATLGVAIPGALLAASMTNQTQNNLQEYNRSRCLIQPEDNDACATYKIVPNRSWWRWPTILKAASGGHSYGN